MSDKPRVNVYSASDYAGMDVSPWRFYYGYEFGRAVDPDDPESEVAVWGFTARCDDRLVASLSFDQLCAAGRLLIDPEDVTTNLLVGIGLCVKNGAFS